MLVKTYCAAVNGLEVTTVKVEVSVEAGQNISLSGLGDEAVRESLSRIRTAFLYNKYKFPHASITVNLAPADLRKEGTVFDLPIAIGILAANEGMPTTHLHEYMLIGELSLDGKLQPIRGALPIAILARKEKYKGIIVPKENAREAAVVDRLEVYGMESLSDVVQFLSDMADAEPIVYDTRKVFYESQSNCDLDFADVRGQEDIKRAMEIAAAGGHNIIMVGPPGSGKSMMAKRLPGILPEMSRDEMIQCTEIHSVAGLTGREHPIIAQRPFRAPHHTVSSVALVGGGSKARPGEISLAHKGVLFLDELPEFRRETLEVLRQPMEEKKVHIARVHANYVFPADCMVLGAMNLCRCGYFPDLQHCTCSEQEIRRYQNRISQPLLDRMDICVEAGKVTYEELTSVQENESSATIQRRVEQVSRIQQERYQGTRFRFNADLDAEGIRQYCQIGEKEQNILREAYQKLGLTARACHRILKVARTIADMEYKEKIQEDQLCEAISYRIFENYFRR